ncbi:hypothetical protein [Actinomadura sp. WMMA1423]|uniref:hypothetical protein n=1 Tax=Actinomadura sp. WMMA1423 TaxID=2591108 RepID=UPI001F0F98A3|nr:hypothetical protein [Actinomadura sp. WMMA1423]
MRRRAPLALLLCGAVAGCGQNARGADVPPPVAPPASAPAVSAPSATSVPTATGGAAPGDAPADGAPAGNTAPLGRVRGWRITTYYTARESLYHGEREAVRGCARFHCSHGKAPLGSYPKDFLKIVQTEGSGRITEGPRAGRYLNWSHSVGFWLDDTTRDSRGRPLRPWASAAADRSVLARGQRFAIVDCGREGNGRAVEDEVCAAFRKARWTVTDLFRPGYGGEDHADVYIGEEKGSRLADSPFYTTLSRATLGPA